jgi:xanthine dehydrogenase accessory factor
LSDREVISHLANLLDKGKPAVLCTVIEKRGSGPRDSGAKLLVDPEGCVIGSIGGGGMERRIVDEAAEVLRTGPKTLHFAMGLEDDEAISIDSKCGGEVKIFLDPIKPDPRLIVIGSGSIAQALAELANKTGFKVILIDDAETATEENFPYAKIKNGSFREMLNQLEVKPSDFVAIVHGETDYELVTLRRILPMNPAYIGLLGSRNKYTEHTEKLVAEGHPAERVQRIKGPIGLDIGAETPEEIAISIIAELIKERQR